MNATTDDPENVTRPCTINVVLIRSDGLATTFQAATWLQFCAQVVDAADDPFWCG